MTKPAAPLLYELNARVYGRRFDEISSRDLAAFRQRGFTHIWLMGIWRISPGALAVSRRFGHDFEGSPYAISGYDVSPEFGDEEALARLRARAHVEGLRILADFVPNHVAYDAPIVAEHPEYFIHGDPSARAEEDHWFFRGPSGDLLAHGRDPNFPPWVDTAQFDYAEASARAYQIVQLKRLASMLDGVRCDMAMLALRDQVKEQWYPKTPRETFDTRYPDEFWREAISKVRKVNGDFAFIAEVYWGKEAQMQHLGFDFTYNKTLYDRLAGRGWDSLAEYFASSPAEFLARSLHFIENHDEERAQQVFGPDVHRLVASLILTLPGAPLIHHGQMEGRRERIPIQVTRPRTVEVDDAALSRFYARMLTIAADPVFRAGSFVPFDAGYDGVVSFLRAFRGRTVLVAIDFRPGLRAGNGKFRLEVPVERFPAPPPEPMRVRDLWTGAFHRPARALQDRIVVDLDGSIVPGIPIHLLEIVS